MLPNIPACFVSGAWAGDLSVHRGLGQQLLQRPVDYLLVTGKRLYLHPHDVFIVDWGIERGVVASKRTLQVLVALPTHHVKLGLGHELWLLADYALHFLLAPNIS